MTQSKEYLEALNPILTLEIPAFLYKLQEIGAGMLGKVERKLHPAPDHLEHLIDSFIPRVGDSVYLPRPQVLSAYLVGLGFESSCKENSVEIVHPNDNGVLKTTLLTYKDNRLTRVVSVSKESIKTATITTDFKYTSADESVLGKIERLREVSGILSLSTKTKTSWELAKIVTEPGEPLAVIRKDWSGLCIGPSNYTWPYRHSYLQQNPSFADIVYADAYPNFADNDVIRAEVLLGQTHRVVQMEKGGIPALSRVSL